MDFLSIGNDKIPIKIALTDGEKAKGLMHKSWPPPAMAFPFDRPLYRSFWMKNTICPLDILFCLNNSIVDIKQGHPLSLEQICSQSICDLVVELPKGYVKKLGIRIGSSVKLGWSLETLAKRFDLTLAKLT